MMKQRWGLDRNVLQPTPENPSTSLVILKFAVFVAYLFCVNRMKNKLILVLQSSKLEYY